MSTTLENAEATDVPPDLKSLGGFVREIYRTTELCDLTLKCEGQPHEWKCHKLVLCAYSDALRKMLQRGAELEKTEEKNTIKLDDEPQVIESMLNYMYTSDYGDFSNSQEHVCALVLDVKVFVLADKYFIKGLSELAAEKFQKRCEVEWSTPEFAAAIEEVYSTTPAHDDRLRKVVLAVTVQNSRTLLNEEETGGFRALLGEQFSWFRAALRKTACFAADLATLLVENNPSNPSSHCYTYQCPTGHVVFSVGVPVPAKFGCPLGCYRAQTSGWWNSYLQK